MANSFPSMPESSKAAVRQSPLSENAGRGLFATQSLAPGDIIFKVKEPLAMVPSGEHFDEVCAYCFASTLSPRALDPEGMAISDKVQGEQYKKCAKCLAVSYCSKECQKNDWTIASHKLECGPFKKIASGRFEDRGKINTNLRVMFHIAMGRKAYGPEWRPWKDFDTLASISLQNCNTSNRLDAEAYMNMVDHFTGKSLEPEVIERLVLQVLLNAIAVTPDDIGACIDPFLSMINHSCEPNAWVYYVGRNAFVNAVKPIMKDEEVTIAYVSTSDPLEERQKILKERYFFDCRCKKCITPEVFLSKELQIRKQKALKYFPVEGVNMSAAYDLSESKDVNNLLDARRCLGPDWPIHEEPYPLYLTLLTLKCAHEGLWSGEGGYIDNMKLLVTKVFPRVYGIGDFSHPKRLAELYCLFQYTFQSFAMKTPASKDGKIEVIRIMMSLLSVCAKQVPLIYSKESLFAEEVLRYYEPLTISFAANLREDGYLLNLG